MPLKSEKCIEFCLYCGYCTENWFWDWSNTNIVLFRLILLRAIFFLLCMKLKNFVPVCSFLFYKVCRQSHVTWTSPDKAWCC